MQEFKDQKVLIVGGAGFVGSNLVQALLRSAPGEVLLVDNLLSAERLNVPEAPEVRFLAGSITDDAILAQLEPDLDYVFHLATFHGNQNSIHDPLADHAHNTLTTLKLYERIKDFRNLKKVVYASAGCTVAEKTFDQCQATCEDASVSLYLDSPYQISKIIGELYSNYYFKQHRLPVVKARFQNVYGPGEILGAGRWRGTTATVWRNVTPTFIYRALKKLPLILENGGIATRDFIYVEDIVEGLMRCAIRGVPGEVYNLARGEETSILELATTINDLADNDNNVVMYPARTWDRSGKRFGSVVKARKEIGFAARTGLKEGLARTISWTRENLALIETCMQKHAAFMPLEV